MKLLILLFLTVWTLIASAQSSEGTQFFHGTWEEALQEAKTQRKPLFVDIWATWCGPCKRLGTEVLPQQKVGEFFNEHFICYKLQTDPQDKAEKKFVNELSNKYHVKALPTLIWVDDNGDLLHFTTGYQEADELIEQGRIALDPARRSGALVNKWNAGDRSFDTGMGYFSIFTDNVQEFETFFHALPAEQKCDSNLLILMEWRMRLPASSDVYDYVATHWEDIYGRLPQADTWKNFLLQCLDKRLETAVADGQAFQQVCTRWRNYRLPFTEWGIDKFLCIHSMRAKDYTDGYRRAEEMMNRYGGNDLWFMVSVLYTLFDQLQEGQLPANVRRPVLIEWTERFISESHPWNADETRVLCYVVVGDEAKARAKARAAKDAQPNNAVGQQTKEYIDYLLSPLKPEK